MTKNTIYEKPGDWTGTTRMLQEINLSYHSGFRDDENKLAIESDICHIRVELFSCDDYTGKEDGYMGSTQLSVESLDILIDALTRARDHHNKQQGIWKENGKTWLSSNKGPHPGPTEEQNRIYSLDWVEVGKVEDKKQTREAFKKHTIDNCRCCTRKRDILNICFNKDHPCMFRNECFIEDEKQMIGEIWN